VVKNSRIEIENAKSTTEQQIKITLAPSKERNFTEKTPSLTKTPKTTHGKPKKKLAADNTVPNVLMVEK